jgi:predicted GIY-YIG superfamily endonuclease
MNNFFVYMLKCSDGSYYIGHTDNIEKRLWEHAHKKFDGYTSARLPVTFVWGQRFVSRESAFVVERKLKKWSRAKKEALIQGDWATISKLASRRKK